MTEPAAPQPLTVDVTLARTDYPNPDDTATVRTVLAEIAGATMSPATAGNTLRALADEIDPPTPRKTCRCQGAPVLRTTPQGGTATTTRSR